MLVLSTVMLSCCRRTRLTLTEIKKKQLFRELGAFGPYDVSPAVSLPIL